MRRSAKLESVRVIRGRESEIHKGWIRLSDKLRDLVRHRAYVRLVVGGRKVYCQIKGEPREPGCLEMSEYYREKLDVGVGDAIDGEVEELGLRGRIRAWCDHPDDIVRAALILGLISMLLGGFGLILGIIGLFY